MKKLIHALFLSLSLVLAAPLALDASAARADEVATANQQLKRIISNLEAVQAAGLHMNDLGRIYILQQSARNVLTSLEQKGLGNLQTLNLYQQLIVKFRFSAQFFEFIRTRQTDPQITDTLTIVAKIREERGFDDDPYSKILKSNLEQIHASVVQLIKMRETSADLRVRLQALVPQLGSAIAIADQGDRPRAFAQAIEIHQTLRGMYPEMHQLSGSPAAFRYVLEIMGLSEFIAEYSQVDRG
ncbi:MAG: hypothetical protein NDJ90_10620 [Oligoflexia bacterium]|nr:hypothetical protein [Oligoflexia bacterium]